MPVRLAYDQMQSEDLWQKFHDVSSSICNVFPDSPNQSYKDDVKTCFALFHELVQENRKSDVRIDHKLDLKDTMNVICFTIGQINLGLKDCGVNDVLIETAQKLKVSIP